MENQKKFNEEKLFHENTIKQREDALNKFQSSLKELQLFLDKEKEKTMNNSKFPIEIGLQNIGAYAYMNATFQAFSNTP